MVKSRLTKSTRLILTSMLGMLLCMVLMGCGGEKTAEGTAGTAEAAGQTAEAARGQKAGEASGQAFAAVQTEPEAVATGRYVEEDVALPEAIADGSENYVTVVTTPDKNLEIYGFKTIEAAGGDSKSEYQFSEYRLKEDDSWEEIESPWLKNIELEGEADTVNVHYGEDGKIYVMCLTYDAEGQSESSVYCVKEDLSAAEKLALPELKKDLEGTGYKPFLKDAFSLADGTIITNPLLSYSPIYSFNGSTGAVNVELEYGGSLAEYFQNQVIMVNEKGNSLDFYDSKSGDVVKSVDFKSTVKAYTNEMISEPGYAYALYSDNETGIMMANGDGLHFLPKDGTLWECVFEGSRCVLGMPSTAIDKLREGKDNRYYVTYSVADGTEKKMSRFYFDPEAKVYAERELKVYSLDESKSVRQSIVEFQRKNPGVTIAYQSAGLENASATRTDLMKALNTELLAGKGADVIITDSLSTAALIDKDVLLDISDMADTFVADGRLMKNIAEGSRVDGKTYSLPSRFIAPIVVARQGWADSAFSMDKIIELMEKQDPDIDEIYEMSYIDTKFDVFYRLFGAAAMEDKDEMGKLFSIYKYMLDPGWRNGVLDASVSPNVNVNLVWNGTKYFSYIELNELREWCGVQAAINIGGLEYKSFSNSYLPKISASINKLSENQELAKSFIEMMFSSEVQEVALDGLPVNAKFYEKWVAEENEDYRVNTGVDETNGEVDKDATEEIKARYGGRHLDFGYGPMYVYRSLWPTREEREALFTLLSGLTSPLEVDNTLKDVFWEYGNELAVDKKTLEEAVGAVWQKASLYKLEQE